MIDAQRCAAAWRGLSSRARLACAVLGASILVAAAFAVTVARDDRVALFSAPLRADQLAEVETRLAAWNVAFASTADNVRVARARRSDLLLRLALAGVPHPHVESSAETLAKLGALTPEAILDAQTRDGLAGDLELGLRGIAGIADARVIIAPAKAGVYADEASRDASASVRLTLLPGARLSSDAIAGIRAFVASGVPGLEPRRITIVDDSGSALSSAGAAGARDADERQAALQSALDATFGPGSAIVRVHVELDPRARETTDVRRASLGGPLTRTTVDERYAGEKKRYSRNAAEEQRGSELREERTRVGAGTTEHVSVAIFLRTERAGDLEKVRALAIGAAGLQLARGDTVTVEAVRFAGDAAPVAPRAWPSVAGLLATFAPAALAAAVALGLARLGLGPLASFAIALVERRAARSAAASITGYAPAEVRGALAGEPPHTAAAIISALPTATAAAVLELYPPEERADIVRRLSRPASPLVPDYQSWLGGARTVRDA